MYVLYIHKTIEPDSHRLQKTFLPPLQFLPLLRLPETHFHPISIRPMLQGCRQESHLPLGFRFVLLSVLPGKTSYCTPLDATFYGQKLEKRYSAYSSPISVQVLFPNSSQEVESIFERNFSIRINPCPRLTNPKAVRVHNELTT